MATIHAHNAALRLLRGENRKELTMATLASAIPAPRSDE